MRGRVLAVLLPARDQVVALVELAEQRRDLGRVVLAVAVEGDDDGRRGCARSRQRARPTCRRCGPRSIDDQVVAAGGAVAQVIAGAVGRSVVDEDQFVVRPRSASGRVDLVDQPGKGTALVEDRDDDRGGEPTRHDQSISELSTRKATRT